MRSGSRLACLLVAGAIAVATMAVACNSSNSGSGQLAVELTSAPGPVSVTSALAPPAPSTVDQLWVCVTQVTAHSTQKGWVPISDPNIISSATPLCIDLLNLQPLPVSLGFAELPPGQVTQIRLLLSQDPNFLPYVMVGGEKQNLTVPSGFESGIKIVGPWDIVACDQLTVTLDFDAPHSIEYHATGQQPAQWILRPVILVKKTSTSFICAEDGGTDGGTDGGAGGETDGGTGGGNDGGNDGGIPL